MQKIPLFDMSQVNRRTFLPGEKYARWFWMLLYLGVLGILTGCPGGGSSGGVDSSATSTNSTSTTTQVSRITVTVSNNNQPADGASTVNLTVVVRDSKDNPLSGVEVSLSNPSNTAVFTALRGTTDAVGMFTTNVTDNVVESFAVAASAGAVKSNSVTVTFIDNTTDPRVGSVHLEIINNNQPANGNSLITVVVIVRDKNDFPLSGSAVKLTNPSNTAVFSALNGVTDAVGRFTTTVKNTKKESFSIIATAGGKISNKAELNFAEVTFSIRVGEIEINATLRVLPVGEKSELTIKLFEIQGFTRVGILDNTPFKVSVSTNGILGTVPEITDASGQATFTVTSNQKGNVTVTVVSGFIKETIVLHFGATLDLLPNSINAIDSATLTALLKDGNGTPIQGQPVTFNFNENNDKTLVPTTTQTTADGTAQVEISDLTKLGGNVVVNATTGKLTKQATVNFLTDLGKELTFQAKASATVLEVGQSATITAIVKDKVGIPSKNQPISFEIVSLDGKTKSATPKSADKVTNDNGEATFTVTDNVGENILVRVKAGTTTQDILLYFGATVTLTPTQNAGTTNVTLVRLTASVKDALESGIAGVTVNFRIPNNNNALLSDFRVITDKTGRANVDVTSTAVENTIVEAKADALKASQATIDFSSEFGSLPCTISLTADIPEEPITLALNSSVRITATVLDVNKSPVQDGTRVSFTKDSSIGNITQTVFTNGGKATALFSAGTTAGSVVVTASPITVVERVLCTRTASVAINVSPGDGAGIIEIKEIKPQEIGIVGSGVAQSATIQFLVKDNLGNAVADGTKVDFTLDTTRLNGGETLSTGETSGTQVTGKTNNGIVTVTLKSGLVAGNADVIAQVGTVKAIARVTIVGGMPDADHFSLATEFLNISGGVRFGLQNKITAYVGDRFGNVVPNNTAISFITEGGTIGQAVGSSGVFTTTSDFGQATAILQTATPTTPNLGGIPAQPVDTSRFPSDTYTISRACPVKSIVPTQAVTTAFPLSSRFNSYKCGSPYTLQSQASSELLCGNPGLVTVLAYTTGSEGFVDANGNGQFDESSDCFTNPGYIDANGNGKWDKGEIITNKGDMSEPYIDANDNGTYDDGEFYVDVNNNKQFDGPNGRYESNTVIWTKIKILFSAETAPLLVTVGGKLISNGANNVFSIPNGSGETFTVINVSDIYGNSLVRGAGFQVTTSAGILGGTTEFVLPDTNAAAQSAIVFTLSGNPPTVDDKGEQKYPLPANATIKVTVTSPLTDRTPGGNGNVQPFVFSGTINATK